MIVHKCINSFNCICKQACPICVLFATSIHELWTAPCSLHPCGSVTLNAIHLLGIWYVLDRDSGRCMHVYVLYAQADTQTYTFLSEQHRKHHVKDVPLTPFGWIHIHTLLKGWSEGYPHTSCFDTGSPDLLFFPIDESPLTSWNFLLCGSLETTGLLSYRFGPMVITSYTKKTHSWQSLEQATYNFQLDVIWFDKFHVAEKDILKIILCRSTVREFPVALCCALPCSCYNLWNTHVCYNQSDDQRTATKHVLTKRTNSTLTKLQKIPTINLTFGPLDSNQQEINLLCTLVSQIWSHTSANSRVTRSALDAQINMHMQGVHKLLTNTLTHTISTSLNFGTSSLLAWKIRSSFS